MQNFFSGSSIYVYIFVFVITIAIPLFLAVILQLLIIHRIDWKLPLVIFGSTFLVFAYITYAMFSAKVVFEKDSLVVKAFPRSKSFKSDDFSSFNIYQELPESLQFKYRSNGIALMDFRSGVFLKPPSTRFYVLLNRPPYVAIKLNENKYEYLLISVDESKINEFSEKLKSEFR